MITRNEAAFELLKALVPIDLRAMPKPLVDRVKGLLDEMEAANLAPWSKRAGLDPVSETVRANLPWCDVADYDHGTLDRVLGFGKHREKTWAEVLKGDPGYLEFLVKSTVDEMGDDVETWGYHKQKSLLALQTLHFGHAVLRGGTPEPLPLRPVRPAPPPANDDVPF